MNRSKLTAVVALIALTAGCDQKPAADKTGPEIDALKQQVAALSSQLQAAQQTAANIAVRVSSLELDQMFDSDTAAHLDPTSKSYAIAKTNLGNLLISVDNLEPYGDGYKLRLLVGNPNMATYDGAKLQVQWAEKPRWGEQGFDGQKWKASVQSKDVDISNDLLPGAWNPVDIVISPATAAQTGYITVTATLDKLYLRRTVQ
ncbi:DUF3251 domain-containing protein [Paraburkholderia sediminicola]|uniref:DUF3251 domain-containing protein n=1 Tax=Paraburkholderia sediminicola TaxID=458836 RepID=UPI0038BC09CC